MGTAENPETMTVPKKQSTAAKKARAVQREADAWAAEEARRAALTPEERAEEDERAREWEYEEMRAAADDGFDPYAKDYGDVD